MKITGIIVEYNPFHYGHLYHLEAARKTTECDLVIAVMSGNFTQRGDPAIVDKWERTKEALKAGVDLVIELPFGFACQSADYFASSALEILNALKVDHLVFGSESNDVELFKKISQTLLENKEEYNIIVKDKMKEGYRYPNACNEALKLITQESITLPNDLLGYSYVKAIVENNYPITPVTIQRTNDYHEMNLNTSFSSASSIRKAIIEGKDVQKATPMIIEHPVTLNDYFELLYYQLIMDEHLNEYHLVEEGIENLLKKHIQTSHNMDELIEKCTSKRFTSSRIKRTIISILLRITKQEHNALKIDYIRVLGMNQKGQEYLHTIKKNCSYPILTNYKPKTSLLLDLEFKASQLYYSIAPLEIREEMMKKEYKNHCLFFTNKID